MQRITDAAGHAVPAIGRPVAGVFGLGAHDTDPALVVAGPDRYGRYGR